jgi:flagellar basal-body rod protein FlgC
MPIDNIFGIAGSALNAQMARMNAVASNLANASTVAGSEKEAYRGKRTVFKAVLEEQNQNQMPRDQTYQGGVRIDALIDDPSPVRRISDPGNPLADKDGFVYLSNVNEMTEMVEMMAASRSYQNNVEVVNTTRQLLMRTIDITRS